MDVMEMRSRNLGDCPPAPCPPVTTHVHCPPEPVLVCPPVRCAPPVRHHTHCHPRPQMTWGHTHEYVPRIRRRFDWIFPTTWWAVPKRRPPARRVVVEEVYRRRAPVWFPCCCLIFIFLLLLCGFISAIVLGLLYRAPTSCTDLPCEYGCKDGACYCPAGWQLKPDRLKCEDFDECVMGTHTCSHCQHCMNRYGSGYTCGCDHGYKLNRNNCCEDVDECATSPCHGGALCVTYVGRYECFCQKGLVYKDDTCQDENECASSPCAYGCQNTYSSYVCHCPTGQVWNSVTRRCQYVTNPCAINNGGCSGSCVPYGAGHKCTCDVSKGYYLSQDGKTCVVFGLNFGGVWLNGVFIPSTSTGTPGVDLDLNQNPTSVTFTCEVFSNVSFTVYNGPGGLHPRLIWLDDNNYLLPCQIDGYRPCSYIVTVPVPVGPGQMIWRTTLTILNPVIPDDLGDYKCKLIYQDFTYCQNFHLNGTVPRRPCLDEYDMAICY